MRALSRPLYGVSILRVWVLVCVPSSLIRFKFDVHMRRIPYACVLHLKIALIRMLKIEIFLIHLL